MNIPRGEPHSRSPRLPTVRRAFKGLSLNATCRIDLGSHLYHYVNVVPKRAISILIGEYRREISVNATPTRMHNPAIGVVEKLIGCPEQWIRQEERVATVG